MKIHLLLAICARSLRFNSFYFYYYDLMLLLVFLRYEATASSITAERAIYVSGALRKRQKIMSSFNQDVN